MWKKYASFVIRYRFFISIALLITLSFLAFNIQPKFSKTSAQLLPSSSQEYKNFQRFVDTFGQEDNLVTIGFKSDSIDAEQTFNAWQKLTKQIDSIDGVKEVLSLTDAQKLEKDSINKSFIAVPIIDSVQSVSDWKHLLEKVQQFPFYGKLIYNPENKALQTAVYLDSDIVNSTKREDIVLEINSLVKGFIEDTGITTHLSGMPVIRTFNTLEVKKESTQFILLSLLVTSLVFLFFFRSLRATLIAMFVVLSAVVLSFASLTLFGFQITILTALVPPLLIVIGIPNCIFLINKYQQEYSKSQRKFLAIYRTIVKVGNPALLTNCTTAFGFLTFIFTDSATLQEFGIIASLNIFGIFLLSFIIIPVAYSFLPPPKERHLRHLQKKWLNFVLDWMKNTVQNHRRKVYVISAILFALGLVGISLMRTSGNILDDMSKKGDTFHAINFFDQEFGGVLPLDILIDTQRNGGATSLSTIKKIEELNIFIDSLDNSSEPIAIDRMVKFAKQAFYNNDSSFYSLPSNQEKNFILNYIKNSRGNQNLLNNYIDSTQTKTRVTLLLQNLDSEALEQTVQQVEKKTVEIFPQENFTTFTTGGAYLFMKGTEYLTKNLLISLSLAIVIIALFMALMFRSFRMIFVAIIPNFLPLITTAGAMGFLGVGLKPSTILVFSIAFGIAVDDTIHYLARYRQQLKLTNGNIKQAVLNAIEETGTSMFYTSIVLFFGFFTFILSGFEGIVALGGLVSITLLVAMVANLILLPSLLLSHEIMTNKNFMEPEVDFFSEEDDLDTDALSLPKE